MAGGAAGASMSDPIPIIESMFDKLPLGPEALGDAEDAALIDAVGGWARLEAAAAARRLAAIAELAARRAESRPERRRWACDNWDAAAAEVAAAENISHGMAGGQLYLASTLRDRLPRVGALFLDGAISARLVSTIVWRTALVTDAEILRRIDAELAGIAVGLGPLSAVKTATAIDTLIDRHDPAALRRTRIGARGRDVVVDLEHCEQGTAAMWGRLYATDAAALDERLARLARGVCDEDPRTVAQRRADALGALAAGSSVLACACGRPECPAGAGQSAHASNVVVHVVAEAAALTAEPDRHMNGEPPPSRSTTPGMTLAEMFAPEPEPDPPAVTSPGLILGAGTIPASLIAELVRRGAAVTPLAVPTDTVAEPGYRPSAALAAFIRCRDLTCRFPGCDRPATHCDIDHAVPHPLGPTHPSNLRCLCRKHHLLKTFWVGSAGWSDRQHPDGTIVWTSPTGQTYTTRPGSRQCFPTLCFDTGALDLPDHPAPSEDRGVAMPLRRRPREQQRARSIRAERALNADRIAERNQAPPF